MQAKLKCAISDRPSRYTENPVSVYNKYGTLDTEEGMESDVEAGKE